MVIVPIRKNCKSEMKRFCWWQLVESAILLSVVANRFTFNLKRLFHLSSLNFFFLERKHNPSSHHGATDHVPEKKFKSEALLSTLTSDASKENTPGSLNCLTFYYFWIEGREIQLYVCFLLFFFFFNIYQRPIHFPLGFSVILKMRNCRHCYSSVLCMKLIGFVVIWQLCVGCFFLFTLLGRG